MRGPAPAHAALLALLLMPGAAPLRAAAQEAVREEIKERVELLRATGGLRLDGERLPSAAGLPDLYEAIGFEPLWSDRALSALSTELEGLRRDGLDPSLYALALLRARRAAGATTPAGRAELDLLASEALLRALRDLRRGRVAGAPERAPAPAPANPDAELLAWRIRNGRISEAVREARPDHPVYAGLVAALARLRDVQAAGGWPVVPDGPSLRRDSADARVPLLRRRLAVEGDLPPAAGHDDAPVFDAALEAAVRSFQHRHALNEDGIVGRATLAELNVPVTARIDQVRVNLERARWVVRDLPATFVGVNAAGAMVYMVRDGAPVFESRAIVGKAYTKTPVFRAEMRYVDLNPTWTVPPGIVGEVLAAVRRDPGYLARQDMRVLDRSGRRVSVSAATLARYTARTFPWVFRQEPGPLNPLGRIKLVFPNPYSVYLHDTPSRQLFEREERTFSHGCIRLQDPVGLAALVLDDPAWTREALEAAIAAGGTRTVPLARPVPVLVLYWTASTDLHGEVHHYRDVYGRDAALLAALDAG